MAILLPASIDRFSARYLQRCCCFGGPIPAEADSSVAELQISFWIDSEHFSFQHGREESWVKLLNLHFDVLCGGVFDVFTGRAMGLRAQLLFTICSFFGNVSTISVAFMKGIPSITSWTSFGLLSTSMAVTSECVFCQDAGPTSITSHISTMTGAWENFEDGGIGMQDWFPPTRLRMILFGLDSFWLKGSGSDRKIAILDKNKAGRLVGRSTRETSESNWVGSGVKKRYYQK